MKRLFLAGAMVAGTLGVLTTIAFAHSRPVRFDPPPGAVLQAAPSQVSGWFTSELRRDPNWSFLQVKDAQGTLVSQGDVTLSSDRRQMTAVLKSGLGPGLYTVTWRTWDDGDGEIFGDCFNFYVGQAAADAAVGAKTRLDAGSSCGRIEVDTKSGTPTPQKIAALATAVVAGDDPDAAAAMHDSGGSGGVPVWALVAGVVVGVVVGGVGGRFLASRP